MTSGGANQAGREMRMAQDKGGPSSRRASARRNLSAAQSGGTSGESLPAMPGDPQPLARSPIWQWQRDYYAVRGSHAWRDGEVPHYVTSNPTMANAYAEILFAFRRDLARRGNCDEPLHVCEIGGGSGRFAFHLLRRLAELCDEAGLARTAFRYILTDIAPANLDFWRAHPCFHSFFEDGMLEVARFDLMRPDELALEVGGTMIGEGSLDRPLVAIANYVFDGVPQDLFHVGAGRCLQCLASLSVEGDPGSLDAAELLDRLRIDFANTPVQPVYAEPELQRILEDYRERLAGTYLLFPAPSLRGIRFLSGLSRNGLLLLSADLGEHRLEGLDGHGPPNPARHGSISLPVNYHAFIRFCEAAGGLALTPERPHDSIDVIGLLMVADAEHHHETRRAYRDHVQAFGPDDFFSITRRARAAIPQMSAGDILAHLRLGRYDSHLFGRCLPRLIELAGDFDPPTGAAIREAADAAWAQYFPLGEELDLASGIAALLYAMDDHVGALAYFERSAAIYGRDTGTLYNMACCLHLLGRDAEAAAALELVLRHDPGNAEARTLLSVCASAPDGAE
jgi:tetratricopeptide (TPR) repeat protein